MSQTKEAPVSPGCVALFGRIERYVPVGDGLSVVLALPAPTNYDRPGFVQVKVPRRIGQKGDEVQITARVGGYNRKPYERRGEGGVLETVQPCDNTLEWVDG